MVLLIPSYEPDTRLLDLIINIRKKCDYDIIIVNDGSGDKYSAIFSAAKQLGCTVLSHLSNRGKGQALKTGFRYILKNKANDGVVCADCDGQHKPEDIMRVADEISKHKNCIILGSRRFTGKVPLRSRFGNFITRKVFAFTTGSHIYDTQTGLRGFSSDILPWLMNVPGDRFEYEMNMLLNAKKAGYSLYEVFIETIYDNRNKSSHFRPITDSVRVYVPILKFSTSSMVSALLDFLLLILLQHVTSNLLISVVTSRMCSAMLNFILNKYFIFTSKSHFTRSLVRYFLLAAIILLLNYTLMHVFFERIKLPLLLSKVLTECTLFLLSYWAQRKFVFRTQLPAENN